MVIELLKAMVGMVALLGAWLAVQRLFAADTGRANEDALAGRSGCHGCSGECDTACEDRTSARHAARHMN